MDITPQGNSQSISDDQDLAKALAGVLPETEMPDEATGAAGLPGEGLAVTQEAMPRTSADVAQQPTGAPTPIAINRTIDSSALNGIKNQALSELRPLLDHVDLPAEEKFDTYLMLIRSTDDASLIEPAHVAARSIADEKKKAESLLEIIKEIDYLSRSEKKTV